jgi:hypothetical protein
MKGRFFPFFVRPGKCLFTCGRIRAPDREYFKAKSKSKDQKTGWITVEKIDREGYSIGAEEHL